MIAATVTLYGIVRHLVAEPRATVELPREFTLADVVQALEARHGPRLREAMVGGDGRLHTFVRVFIGGEEIEGDLAARFGPFAEDEPGVDIFVVPLTEGGRE